MLPPASRASGGTNLVSKYKLWSKSTRQRTQVLSLEERRTELDLNNMVRDNIAMGRGEGGGALSTKENTTAEHQEMTQNHSSLEMEPWEHILYHRTSTITSKQKRRGFWNGRQ
jgi:hypothetical protein